MSPGPPTAQNPISDKTRLRARCLAASAAEPAVAGEWVSLPLFGEGGFAASDAAMQVLSGVQVNPDGTVTATVNFGGTFVLVGR